MPLDSSGYPSSMSDSFKRSGHYALRLMTGEEIHFERAETHGDYVKLFPLDPSSYRTLPGPDSQALVISWPNGVDVKVAHVVWCAVVPN